MVKKQPPPVFLKIGDVAQILRVTKLTVYNMVWNDDGLPVKRIGKRRLMRIPRKAFLEWAGLTEDELNV